MKRPFVSIPQEGPGHKAVRLTCGHNSLRIECSSNAQAKELSMSLIGLFKRTFPKPSDTTTETLYHHELEH